MLLGLQCCSRRGRGPGAGADERGRRSRHLPDHLRPLVGSERDRGAHLGPRASCRSSPPPWPSPWPHPWPSCSATSVGAGVLVVSAGQHRPGHPDLRHPRPGAARCRCGGATASASGPPRSPWCCWPSRRSSPTPTRAWPRVDPNTVEAARGMGMTGSEVLWRVELPVALPLLLTGVRVAAVQVVATATLGALVGFSCLGSFIIEGNVPVRRRPPAHRRRARGTAGRAHRARLRAGRSGGSPPGPPPPHRCRQTPSPQERHHEETTPARALRRAGRLGPAGRGMRRRRRHQPRAATPGAAPPRPTPKAASPTARHRHRRPGLQREPPSWRRSTPGAGRRRLRHRGGGARHDGYRDVELEAFAQGKINFAPEYAASMLEALNKQKGEATADALETTEKLNTYLDDAGPAGPGTHQGRRHQRARGDQGDRGRERPEDPVGPRREGRGVQARRARGLRDQRLLPARPEAGLRPRPVGQLHRPRRRPHGRRARSRTPSTSP